jgi:hypothetical protein
MTKSENKSHCVDELFNDFLILMTFYLDHLDHHFLRGTDHESNQVFALPRLKLPGAPIFDFIDTTL